MSTGGQKKKSSRKKRSALLGASIPQTNKKYWAGIDPGKNGAVVVISEDGFEAAHLLRRCVKNTEWLVDELNEVIANLSAYKPTTVMEKQHAKRGQGLSSTFTTGYGYGLLVSACSAQSVSFEIFYSRKWQAVLSHEKGETAKDKALALAYRTFPELNELTKAKHTGLSDAACMALFARSRDGEQSG